MQQDAFLSGTQERGEIPRYFPIEKGVYELGPGLRPLGFDLGQGEWDRKFFQISADFPVYRKNKLKCRQERLSKYRVQQDLDPSIKLSISLLILQKLETEYADLVIRRDSGAEISIGFAHTQDRAEFDQNWNLLGFAWGPDAISMNPIPSEPQDLMDLLSLQVPEDLVLVSGPSPEAESRGLPSDRLSYLNVCSPTHWSPEEKLGQSFLQVHLSIPGVDKLLRASSQLVEAMIHKGPYVRFVWSFVTDTRLNHHPEPPSGVDPIWWRGRSFDESKAEPFYFRAERQITWGFPELNTALFLIRVSFYGATEIRADEKKKAQLLSALQSMTSESRAYKGVAKCFDQLCAWLNSTDA